MLTSRPRILGNGYTFIEFLGDNDPAARTRAVAPRRRRGGDVPEKGAPSWRRELRLRGTGACRPGAAL